jgi:hypothetical protein
MNDGGSEIASPEGQPPLAMCVGAHVRTAAQHRPDPLRVPRPIYEAPSIVDRGPLTDLTRVSWAARATASRDGLR